MIYLKTIIASPYEIKFVKLNLKESFTHIDRFIICEYNKTHIGEPKEFMFDKYFDSFTKEEKEKIIYIKGDLSHSIDNSKNSFAAHKNERLMRGYFVNEINLKPDDIVFSVDADEIIFEQNYKTILKKLKIPWINSIKLPMHQFFYRINYLWEKKDFNSAIACKARYFMKEYPSQWRDEGKLFNTTVGCHFSWCLTIDEMLSKLNSYAHRYDYSHLAHKEILEDAIEKRIYPFDNKIDFNIRILDLEIEKQYYPKSLFNMHDEFKHLIYR